MKLYDVIKKEKMAKNKDPFPEIETEEVQRAHRRRDRERSLPPGFSWRKVMIIGAILAFVALIYIVGMKLVHARIVIMEREIPFSLQGTTLELTHEKDATLGTLSFQTMVVSTEVTREVYGGELQPSSSTAKGKVVFINEYSKSSQTVKIGSTLISNTGKKYQTQQTVTVPGYTLKGTIKVPGTSTSVPIVAAAVGPSYNADGASFTVSGWSTAASKQFHAQSEGAITGGDDGVAHMVSSADKPGVIATLQTQLIERLKREARAQIPDNLVSFPDLQFTTVDADSLQLKGKNIKFPASIKGTMVSYLISRDLLENAIAARVLSDHSYTEVSIPALGDVKVVPVTPIPTDPQNVPETITIKVSGEGTIITKAPLGLITESLLGIPKRNFSKVISSVPEIDNARFSLIPFWAPFFPTKEKNFTIVVK